MHSGFSVENDDKVLTDGEKNPPSDPCRKASLSMGHYSVHTVPLAALEPSKTACDKDVNTHNKNTNLTRM